MAISAHMTLTGKTQGAIEGSVDMAGREKSILVTGFEHDISIGSDKLTGRPTSDANHGAFVILKEFDKASPKLYKALTKGERFSDVTLKWFRITPEGRQEHYFTQKLENAILVSIKPKMENTRDPAKEAFTHMEEVSFRYDKITWTWEPDGIAADASWTGEK